MITRDFRQKVFNCIPIKTSIDRYAIKYHYIYFWIGQNWIPEAQEKRNRRNYSLKWYKRNYLKCMQTVTMCKVFCKKKKNSFYFKLFLLLLLSLISRDIINYLQAIYVCFFSTLNYTLIFKIEKDSLSSIKMFLNYIFFSFHSWKINRMMNKC